MNIYSIRDRLLDFMAPPFVAPSDNQVKQALANTVNNGKDTDAYKAAPHHFELWRLATVSEHGQVSPQHEFLCDLSSLVRTGLRGEQVSGVPRSHDTTPESAGSSNGASRTGGTEGSHT